MIIKELGDPIGNQDAATKGYVDSRNINDADPDPGNEIQDLILTGNLLTITKNGEATVIDLTPYLVDNQTLDNSVTGSVNTLTILNGNSVDIDINDGDFDPLNELQDLNLSGNTLSITGDVTPVDLSVYVDTDDQDLSLSGNTLSLTGDATSIDLSSYLDNTDNQDLSLTSNTLSLTGDPTMIDLSAYLDNTDNQDLLSVLAIGSNAGANRITNVGDPVADQDAVTKAYLDTKDATDYAFKVKINITSTGGDFTFNLTPFDFDEGGIISASQIQVNEDGVYMFVIKGNSQLISPADLYISINSTDYLVFYIEAQSEYKDTFLFKLNVNDVIELKAVSSTLGELFTLEFFGYKI